MVVECLWTGKYPNFLAILGKNEYIHYFISQLFQHKCNYCQINKDCDENFPVFMKDITYVPYITLPVLGLCTGHAKIARLLKLGEVNLTGELLLISSLVKKTIHLSQKLQYFSNLLYQNHHSGYVRDTADFQ